MEKLRTAHQGHESQRRVNIPVLHPADRGRNRPPANGRPNLPSGAAEGADIPFYVPIEQECALFEAAFHRRLPLLLKGPTGCGKTRFGAAVRHVAGLLADRPQRQRLLLLLSDGKPNDMDHYEGRYAIEDTRKAIQEARRAGLAVFGITIDRKAQDYFPVLFGPGAYAMVHHIDRLPQTLPIIYRQLIG